MMTMHPLLLADRAAAEMTLDEAIRNVEADAQNIRHMLSNGRLHEVTGRDYCVWFDAASERLEAVQDNGGGITWVHRLNVRWTIDERGRIDGTPEAMDTDARARNGGTVRLRQVPMSHCQRGRGQSCYMSIGTLLSIDLQRLELALCELREMRRELRVATRV